MGLRQYSKTLKAMGSRCEIKLYAENENAANPLLAAAEDRLRTIESKYTRYKPNSVTSTINRSAGSGEAIPVDTETAGLLHYADTLYQQSNGLFDISAGILRQAWDFRSQQLPTQAQLAPLLPKIGWPKITWNTSAIALPVKGMEIDFGGFVKEYAADQLATLLSTQGVQHGLINLGGDISVIGPHPNDSPWIVGIQHPRLPNTAIARIPLLQGAIATSGDYERYMLINNIRYSHLMNPTTGYPIHTPFASVSVIANQCLIAGSFSTLGMLHSEANPHWIDTSGVAFLGVRQDMTITGNISRY